MMKLLIGILTFLPSIITAQLTWSDGAAELIFENCSVCHNSNGIAPFSLMTYDEVTSNIQGISDAIESGYMPPWTADDEYSNLAHSRSLTDAEKVNLLSWLEDGAPSGELAQAPPAPVFANEGFIQVEPDLEVEMEPYTSSASAFQDDYVCISIPTGLTEDKVIRGFEVIPGNPAILHHCLVYIDEEGTYSSDFSGFCGGPNNDEGLIGGFAPGAFPTVFPSDGEDFNMGITLPAGSNIVLALHYPHGSAGEVDQSKVKFYFYEEDVEIREVQTHPLLENWNFSIAPNTQEEVMADFSIGNQDISIFSVFPHMHLVGEYIQSYAVSPNSDIIPLIRIPHWDFEWQEFYFFDHLQRIPAGSTLYANGTYNNTADNPHNPNDPPATITAGLNTSDEMFLVYFHFMEYMDGDEDLDLEELTVLSTAEIVGSEESVIAVYPNPAENEVNFDLSIVNQSLVSLYIYDGNGRVIEKVLNKAVLTSDVPSVIWNTADVPSGTYYYSLLLDGKPQSGAVVVK